MALWCTFVPHCTSCTSRPSLTQMRGGYSVGIKLMRILCHISSKGGWRSGEYWCLVYMSLTHNSMSRTLTQRLRQIQYFRRQRENCLINGAKKSSTRKFIFSFSLQASSLSKRSMKTLSIMESSS